jgi:hypothetical protein
MKGRNHFSVCGSVTREEIPFPPSFYSTITNSDPSSVRLAIRCCFGRISIHNIEFEPDDCSMESI